MSILLFILILFAHTIGDYYLQSQSFLADLKTKSWWEKQTNDPMYKDDYMMGLLNHAIQWSVTVHLPIILFIMLGWHHHDSVILDTVLMVSFLIHTGIHAYVDDVKANKHKINLITDQIIHFVQLITIWLTTCAHMFW